MDLDCSKLYQNACKYAVSYCMIEIFYYSVKSANKKKIFPRKIQNYTKDLDIFNQKYSITYPIQIV